MIRIRPLLAILITVAVAGAASPPSPRPYVYRVLEFDVTDGDTIRTRLDLGFDFETTLSARIQGIDTPELSTPAGKAVRDFVSLWCAKQQTLLAESVSRDKYAGRYVAKIHGDTEELGEMLLARKLAKLYDGGTKSKWVEIELARIERAARTAIAELEKQVEATSTLADETDVDSLFATPSSIAPRSATTVYVTDTGKKYHTAGCRHLDDSKRAISIDEAKKKYDPCKHCKP